MQTTNLPSRAPHQPNDTFRILIACASDVKWSTEVAALLEARVPDALPTRYPGSVQVLAVQGDTRDAQRRDLVDLIVTCRCEHARRQGGEQLLEAPSLTLPKLTEALEAIAGAPTRRNVRPLGRRGVAAFLAQLAAAAMVQTNAVLEDREDSQAPVRDVDRLVAALRRVALGGWPMAARAITPARPSA